MKNNILLPQYNKEGVFLRKIRSFVCRKGRMTDAQLYAINNYWSKIGIDFQLKPLDFFSIFNSTNPIVLEIGFGSGKSLVKNAINFPDKNFLGIEVYKSGIGSCLNFAYISKVENLKIIYYDATEAVDIMIADQSLSIVQIFFPDPWNKNRHKKRRMIKTSFLKVISKKLTISGILHIATDSKEYAYYILDQIKDIPKYKNLSKTNNFVTCTSRISTEFEKKALLRGDCIFDLMFEIKI